MRLSQPQLADGTQLTLKLNGKTSAVTGTTISGQPLVPVAAVARELGLQVYYDAENGGNGPWSGWRTTSSPCTSGCATP